MRNMKIYRDKQNNKSSQSYRIRVVNTDVPSMRDSLTIYLKNSNEADRVELFLYKLLSSIEEEK